MTDPRFLLTGTTYLVTRRCTQREFLLKPSALTNLIVKYVVAVAATRSKVHIHAVCVMSDHWHIVVTDPDARLPDFARLLDGIVAKAMNALYGRREYFWGPGSYNAVALGSPGDVVKATAYTLTNPVKAGLVKHGRQWPGVWSDPRSIGEEGEVVPRPGHYFKEDGSMPENAVLVLEVPPGFGSAEAFRTAVMLRVQQLEEAAAEERKAKDLEVLGARRVLRQRPTERASSFEPLGGLRPRVAAQDKGMRIELLKQLESFLAEYRDALLRFWRGEREVVFPRGTYLMRVRFGVACASS